MNWKTSIIVAFCFWAMLEANCTQEKNAAAAPEVSKTSEVKEIKKFTQEEINELYAKANEIWDHFFGYVRDRGGSQIYDLLGERLDRIAKWIEEYNRVRAMYDAKLFVPPVFPAEFPEFYRSVKHKLWGERDHADSWNLEDYAKDLRGKDALVTIIADRAERVLVTITRPPHASIVKNTHCDLLPTVLPQPHPKNKEKYEECKAYMIKLCEQAKTEEETNMYKRLLAFGSVYGAYEQANEDIQKWISDGSSIDSYPVESLALFESACEREGKRNGDGGCAPGPNYDPLKYPAAQILRLRKLVKPPESPSSSSSSLSALLQVYRLSRSLAHPPGSVPPPPPSMPSSSEHLSPGFLHFLLLLNELKAK
ncbi:hypothetical protein FACS1894122_08190 [Alphaproteobacteria bacterium]|nr:hypothetical protein FACS1894122_08190 [Alphaproteobacteria bacterium]